MLPIRIEDCHRCKTHDRLYDDHDVIEWANRHRDHLHETHTVERRDEEAS